MRATLLVVTCLIPVAAHGAPIGFAHQLSHSINDSPDPGPDGKRMVYIVGIAGREQLFLANLDGSKPVQLTHDDFDHEDPAWSPDGTKIAFVSMKDGGETIAIMNPDGTHVEPLTPKGNSEVFLANTQGSDVQLVANTDGRATAPQWARDGATLYFPIFHNIALGADCQIYTAPAHAAKP